MTEKTDRETRRIRGDAVLPLDVVANEFAALTTGPSPVTIDGHHVPGFPNRLLTLSEVRSRLLVKTCPARTRDTVWSLVVRRAQDGRPDWVLASAGLALPSLAASARTLGKWYRGDRADLHAAIIAGFLQALSSADPARKGLFDTLRWAAYRAGHAAVMDAAQAPLPISSDESSDVLEIFWSRFRSTVPRPPWGHPDLVLARAVADGIVTPVEADLIGRTRLEDDTLAAWAQEHHVPYSTANNTRWRAERRLVTYLLQDLRDCEPDDHVLPAVTTSLALRVAQRPGSPRPVSRAVSGRARNGRMPRRSRSSRSVRDRGRKSGLLRCRGSAPAGRPSSREGPDSEVR